MMPPASGETGYEILSCSPYQLGCWLRQGGRTGTLPGLGGVPVLVRSEERDVSKITVVDGIMGSGKTSWSIQKTNQSDSENFLYITPFLDEVDRFIGNSNKEFKQPINKGNGKLNSLNEMLACQEDIASTHALFRYLDEESRDYIKNGHYTLILDEVLNVIEPYDNIRNDDMQLLKDSGCITIDDEGFIVWDKDKSDYDTKYNEIKLLAENRSLMCINKKLLLWRYPPEIFELFDKVYILTYMFEASILKNYFDLYKIRYEIKSIAKEGEWYQLVDYFVPDTSVFLDKINIYEGKLNNNIHQKRNGLSATWVRAKINQDEIRQLKKNIYNYFGNIIKAKAETIIWTTYKECKGKLKGKGYSREFTAEQLKNTEHAYGFLACNARSTNKYADCYNLVYCVNLYLHPATSQFFLQRGITVDEDLYAVSEMIQWIWRSRIRKGESINIYIPSVRMRRLLMDWMQMNFQYQDRQAS